MPPCCAEHLLGSSLVTRFALQNIASMSGGGSRSLVMSHVFVTFRSHTIYSTQCNMHCHSLNQALDPNLPFSTSWPRMAGKCGPWVLARRKGAASLAKSTPPPLLLSFLPRTSGNIYHLPWESSRQANFGGTSIKNQRKIIRCQTKQKDGHGRERPSDLST